jgi:hypothetical protein
MSFSKNIGVGNVIGTVYGNVDYNYNVNAPINIGTIVAMSYHF